MTARTSEFFEWKVLLVSLKGCSMSFHRKIAQVFRKDAILWMTKPFERPEVFNKRVTKSFERFDVSSGRVTKPFRRLTNGL